MPFDEPEPVWRTFDFSDGSQADLVLYPPRADGADWRCDYTLGLPDKPVRSYAMGVDPLQAVLLALDIAQVHLLLHSRDKGMQVTWLGTEPGLPDGPGSLRLKAD